MKQQQPQQQLDESGCSSSKSLKSSSISSKSSCGTLITAASSSANASGSGLGRAGGLEGALVQTTTTTTTTKGTTNDLAVLGDGGNEDNDDDEEEKEMLGGCCVCADDTGFYNNLLVYCDGVGCHVAVHQGCYGIATIPNGQWFCRPCEYKRSLAISGSSSKPTAANSDTLKFEINKIVSLLDALLFHPNLQGFIPPISASE
jgi:hypothetical protein